MVAFKTLLVGSAALLNMAYAVPTPEAAAAEAIPWNMADDEHDYDHVSNLTNTYFDDGTPFSAAEFHYGQFEKRQTTLLAGFIAWLGPLIIGKIEGTPPACSTGFISEGKFYYAVTKGKINGNHGMACWMFDEGLMEWTQKDADAAKCLTDLHYRQSDVCISVKGSHCDKKGYTKDGGRLQNLRIPTLGDGTRSGLKISGAYSKLMQAAQQSLVGHKVQGVGTNGPLFQIVTNSKGTAEPETGPPDLLQVNWIGEQAC